MTKKVYCDIINIIGVSKLTIDKLPVVMIRCLLSTIIIELLLALILGVRDKKDILNIILVNTMTNPLLVSLITYITYNKTYNRTISIIIMEILVVIIEGLTYKKILKFNKKNPYILSLILNASSFLIGEIINYLIY